MNNVVCTMTVTVDSYIAGPSQTQDKPFGNEPDEALHCWMSETAEENKAELESITAAGAFIMGRTIFGPIRGAWAED